MTQKAYRRTEAEPSKNSRLLSFPVNSDNQRSWCLLCGGTGWRYPNNNLLLGVIPCVCRGGRRDVRPVEDFKVLAGGGER